MHDNCPAVAVAGFEEENFTTIDLNSDSNSASANSVANNGGQQQLRLRIDRPVLRTTECYPSLQDRKSKKSSSKWRNATKLLCHLVPTSKPRLSTVFPILSSFRGYNLRTDLPIELFASLTIFVMHVPNGLTAGLLAGSDPMMGIYAALFPGLVYAFLGGSRHVNFSNFAVISLACKDVVDQVNARGEVADPKEMIVSICLLVGLTQTLFGVLRLGVLSVLISDPIISALASGAAAHVISSQLFSLADLNSGPVEGEPEWIPFKLVISYYRLIARIPEANLVTLSITATTAIILLSVKNGLEPWLVRRFHWKTVVIPIDIAMVCAVTFASYLFDFQGRYGVKVIPTTRGGFDQMPTMPRVDLWVHFVPQAVMIAFIAYTSTYSLQKLYSTKHGYSIEPNRELVAMGLANIVASAFVCIPAACSLSRSALTDRLGGKTQLVGLLSSAFLVVFVQFFSQYLQWLPMCTLACILSVALMSTLGKARDLPGFWRASRYDGLLWLSTMTLVLLTGIDFGLLYSIAVGLVLTVLKLATAQCHLKWNVPNTECYVTGDDAIAMTDGSNAPKFNAKHNTSSTEVLVVEFGAPLIFLNLDRFLEGFNRLVGQRVRHETKDNQSDIPNANAKVHTVVLDFGRVSYMDPKSAKALLELRFKLSPDAKLQGHHNQPLQVLFANLNRQTLEVLRKSQTTNFETVDRCCFLTTHDAVLYAKDNYR